MRSVLLSSLATFLSILSLQSFSITFSTLIKANMSLILLNICLHTMMTVNILWCSHNSTSAASWGSHSLDSNAMLMVTDFSFNQNHRMLNQAIGWMCATDMLNHIKLWREATSRDMERRRIGIRWKKMWCLRKVHVPDVLLKPFWIFSMLNVCKILSSSWDSRLTMTSRFKIIKMESRAFTMSLDSCFMSNLMSMQSARASSVMEAGGSRVSQMTSHALLSSTI